MKFIAPDSYTDNPGRLIIEYGDPSIDEIKRIFMKKGLQVIQKPSLVNCEVIILKPEGFFKKVFISIISPAAYIYMQGEEAMKELKNS